MTPETPAYITYGGFAVFALYGLIAPLFGFTPTKWNKSAEKNNLLWVEMMRPDLVKRTGQHFNGLYAQAACERWLTWFICLALTAPIAFYTGNPFALLAPFVFSLVLNKVTFIYRAIDLTGRACETLVAVQDAGYDNYLFEESARLKRGHRGNFTSYGVDEIASMIEARFGIARILVGLLKRNWS